MFNRKTDIKNLEKIVLTALTWGAIIVSAYYIANPSSTMKKSHTHNYNNINYFSQEKMDSR